MLDGDLLRLGLAVDERAVQIPISVRARRLVTIRTNEVSPRERGSN